MPVGFGSFDQAVDLRAGGSALRRVAEQPVLAADADAVKRSRRQHGAWRFTPVMH